MKELIGQMATQLVTQVAINQQLKKANKRMGAADKCYEFDEVISSKLSVRLSELDMRDHLPNYRFLQLIEQHTNKWLQATGLIKTSDFAYWLMAAQQLVYLQQLKPKRSFFLDSQVIGWDDKYIYQIHSFFKGKDRSGLAAVGLTKIVLINRSGQKIAPTAFVNRAAQKPVIINSWLAAQAEIKAFFAA